VRVEPDSLPTWLHWRTLNKIDTATRPSRAEFVARWGAPAQPVKLLGMTDAWPAHTRWSFDFFARRYGACDVNVEAHGTGALKVMPLADYLAGIEARAGRGADYLKDWVFSEQAPELCEDYAVPELFPCYFSALEPALRPVFRWIYIGPRDSAASYGYFFRPTIPTSITCSMPLRRRHNLPPCSRDGNPPTASRSPARWYLRRRSGGIRCTTSSLRSPSRRISLTTAI
jgi:hypothetical protein